MKSEIILLLFTAILVILSYFSDKEKTLIGIKKGIKMFFGILPSFLSILVFISVILYFIPQENIVKWLGRESGGYGIFIAAAVGSISLIPGFIAFPICNILLKNGAAYSTVTIFITTLMMVGIITFPVEKRMYGLKVAFLRNALSFIGAIIIGVLVGLLC